MVIKKIFNNNIILAEDDKQLEHIILGRGIAFQEKKGNTVEQSKIDKVFVLKSDQTMDKFIQLLDEIPVNQLEVTTKIVDAAEKELETTFDDSIYIGLTDHIHYAVDRYKKKHPLKNALLWEIKKFYGKEFRAALHSLEIINYYEEICLDEHEAGYIALHFVNAQQDGEEMQQTIITTEVIEELVKIVKYHFKMDLDENSLNYARFVTHMKFFLKRIFQFDLAGSDDESVLYDQVTLNYPEAASCVNKLVHYLEKKFAIQIHNDEKLYLILHVQRLSK